MVDRSLHVVSIYDICMSKGVISGGRIPLVAGAGGRDDGMDVVVEKDVDCNRDNVSYCDSYACAMPYRCLPESAIRYRIESAMTNLRPLHRK